jgi:hypothetical protein
VTTPPVSTAPRLGKPRSCSVRTATAKPAASQLQNGVVHGDFSQVLGRDHNGPFWAPLAAVVVGRRPEPGFD